jgi:hypothetical protein
MREPGVGPAANRASGLAREVLVKFVDSYNLKRGRSERA